jgi:membrane protein YqaA with SNARE-associated domain
MWPWLARILAPSAESAGDRKNLRVWFVVYLAWLLLLAGISRSAIGRAEAGSDGHLGLWLLALGVFYLSLCCLFFPLPTAWMVFLLASNDVGLVDSVPVRVLVVASTCALATAMANLNEYHILTFLLRYGPVGRVRQTHVYDIAARWFNVSPFWTITAFSFIPIPVDVVRVLAVAARYNRFRFASAYFVGRLFRYGLFAWSSAALNLSPVQIAAIQAVFVLLAGLKVAHGAWKRRRAARAVLEKSSG